MTKEQVRVLNPIVGIIKNNFIGERKRSQSICYDWQYGIVSFNFRVNS